MYSYLKALHIIFVVCWFAGLFYIVRLFVYYAETYLKESLEQKILKDQYRLMTLRLWNIITWPSAILTTIFGIWMLFENPILLEIPWVQIKLVFVVLLWLYHYQCQKYVREIVEDRMKQSSSFFRLWNEGATLLLFAIVFLAVLKSSITWIFGVVGLISVAILLMLGIKLYKKYRERNPNK